MVVGVDFGIGLASGALFEAVKAIWDLVEEIKANKAAALRLALQCQTYQAELIQIFRDAEVNGLQEGPIFETVKTYTLNFKIKLDDIRKDMRNWTQLDLWARITKKGVMAEAIAVYHQQLLEMWQVFQAGLQGQILASGARLHTVARSNSMILEALSTVVSSLKEEFTFAQLEDQRAYKDLMQTTAQTLINVKNMRLDMSDALTNVLQAPQQKELVASLVTQNAKASADIEDPDVTEARNNLIRALESYKGDHPLFSVDPSELTVPVEIHRGDHAVICKGVRAGHAVAIKKVNVESDMVETFYKRVNRESKIWKALQHPNVVPFLGCCGPKDEFPFMLSEWMVNGNARVYARKGLTRSPPEYVDCIKIVLLYRTIISLLTCAMYRRLDIAEGLLYLHSQSPPIIHGGLKASNILIDANGRARITDFALASIAAEVQTGSRPPPMRWSAPEVLEGEDREPSSDIYSFACVVLEIITDKDPFSTHTHLYRLHRLIREGLRPDFPSSDEAWRRGLTSQEGALWKLMKACWAPRPDHRPNAIQVRDCMREIWKSRGGGV